MRCRNCNSENPEGQKFCDNCGAALTNRCPRCGAATRPGKRFCGDCGAALTPAAAALAPRSGSISTVQGVYESDRKVPDGERKTVTALFADIKGSTELMESLDPEEARAIVDPALKRMIDAVHRYGGYIVQSTGDGIFALFGAPAAYEDHPQRALHAALRLQDGIHAYSAKLVAEGGTPLEARVGINTGEVVVRTLTTAGHTEYTPIGHTANLAARMQAVAPTGSIAISEDTRRLVEGFFLLKPRGPTRVKGLNEPINVYEVVGLGPLRTRLQRAAGRGLTKFVGREHEMEVLKRALDRAKAGHGQIVAAMGEPGVGKSRLFYEFKAISHSGCMMLEAYSVSHGKASAYLPVIELLQGYFKIISDDDPRTRREKITGRVLALDRALEDTLPYLFALFGLPEERDALAGMDASIRKRRTLEAIKRIVLRESLNQPLIVIFEDLHWIDEQTQELLNLLADSIGTARIILLVNYRTEYSHTWTNKTYYEQLRLDPLGRESAEEMLTALLGEGAELEPLKRLIIEKTEGTPFFMEEMVQALFEQQVLARNGGVHLTRPLAELKIPPTVQAILASRIDRLPADEKDLLQTLAVIGWEFSASLVREVVGQSDDRLDRMLNDLQLREFIYEQPAAGEAEYIFKHVLTQGVAYNSLLLERRRLLHERAGAAIEQIWSGRLDDHVSELARHYERSGNTGKALEYLGRAAQQAMARSSHAEAVGLFTSALGLLKTLPETPERIQQELALQLGLGPALQCIKGWAAPEVDSVYARARELCRQLGETPQLFPVLFGLWLLSASRAQLQIAREQAQQLLSIAQNRPDADVLLAAHWALGQALFSLGELVPARTHLERASSLYDPTRHRSLAALYTGLDSGVASLVYAAWTEWLLGYPDQAVGRAERARALAEELSHPFSLCLALRFSSVLHTFRREGEAALKFADESTRLATEHGFQQVLAYAICYRGGALVERGQAEEGVAQLREGLAALHALGSGVGQTMMLGWQAAAYGRLGRVEEGLAAVAEALAAAERTGERYWEAELYRLRGDLLLKRDAQESESKVEGEAQVCFRRAIETARRRQAKSLELRATTSLARLLANQGRRDEAHALLAEIYNWFTEGFDTADLRDAKALLDELSA